MSRRHRIRLLESEQRYVCSARGCKFTGTYEEAVRHLREVEREAA